eukprot:SAG22_NODE_2975_length_2057_cov_1.755873_1_plen_564_part_01
MAQPAPGEERLRCRVCYCDSAAVEFPPTNLERDGGAAGHGWRTKAHTQYPVEIGLQFVAGRVNLRRLALTSHQSLIASKAEILVGAAVESASSSPAVGLVGPADYATAIFTKLGHTAFDSNERSGHRARELKSVTVDATAHFLKLLLHRPHPNNALNPAQQVGLVQALAFGTVEAAVPYGRDRAAVPDLLGMQGSLAFAHDRSLDAHLRAVGLDPRVKLPPKPPPAMEDTADFAIDEPGLGQEHDIFAAEPAPAPPPAPPTPPPPTPAEAVEEETADAPPPPPPPPPLPDRPHTAFYAESLASLAAEKAAAVSGEQYDVAKLLKSGLAELQSLSEQNDIAEDAKEQCVQREDYDGAMAQKAHIQTLAGRARSLLEQLRRRDEWAGQSAGPILGREPGAGSAAGGAWAPGSPAAAATATAPATAAAGDGLLHAERPRSGEAAPLEVLNKVAEPLTEAALAEHQSLVELFGQYTVQCLCSADAELQSHGLQQVDRALRDRAFPTLEPPVLHNAAVDAALPALTRAAAQAEAQGAAATESDWPAASAVGLLRTAWGMFGGGLAEGDQ